MNEFLICERAEADFTIISNDFIDNYMLEANGDSVKIYIYLLRCISDSKRKISLNEMAADMDLTVNAVKKTISYWEARGLLKVDNMIGNGISRISFNTCISRNNPISTDIVSDKLDGFDSGVLVNDIEDKEYSNISKFEIRPVKNTQKLQKLLNDEDIKNIIYVAEQYLGRPMNSTDVNTLSFIYDNLGFSYELTEHLLAYCVSNHHDNINYIQKVAMDWHDNGIMDIDSAKKYVANYNQDYYKIMNCFGIRDRAVTNDELAYMQKWLEEWKFSLSIVLIACQRTVEKANKPTFNYADTILSRWRDANVQNLEDIERLDAEFQSRKKKRKAVGAVDYVGNAGDNKYNFEQIELNLVNRQK